LVKFQDLFTQNILSWTGQNIIEQWDDSATFYNASQTTPATSIQSYYKSDLLDADWYFRHNYYKLLFSIRPLTATSITITTYLDFSTTEYSSNSITCPTTSSPNQYARIDLPTASDERRRIAFKISCSALRFGVSDVAIESEAVQGGGL
jgi:hypothetical protein